MYNHCLCLKFNVILVQGTDQGLSSNNILFACMKNISTIELDNNITTLCIIIFKTAFLRQNS